MSKKILCLVGAGILTILIILSVVGLVTGRLYAGIKQPEQKVNLTSAVCSSEIIDKYNKTTAIFDKNESKKELQGVVSLINSKSGYESDPSCTFMLTKSYMKLDDMDKFKSALDSYAKLIDKGAFPNVQVFNVQPPDSVKGEADIFWSTDNSTTESTDKSGGG